MRRTLSSIRHTLAAHLTFGRPGLLRRPLSARQPHQPRTGAGWPLRAATTLLLALVLGAGSLPQSTPVRAQQDARYFEDTGFRVDNDKIWDYFAKRGGKRTFGLPTSRTFQFMGSPTQFFQRHVLQVKSDGVKTLNLLEDGLLPYTTMAGSTFPAVDQGVVGAAPKAGSASYGAEIASYLEKYAPDTFEGEPVGFGDTFAGTVTLADAFPDGGGDAGLLTLLNLEIWGLPTSKPTRDPGNNSFIYLRFQRGIMHYDTGCKCTQGLLLADYLKALITGQNVPDDLLAQASGAPLQGQYDMGIHNGPLHSGLPGGTELANAFRPSLDSGQAGTPPTVQQTTAQKPESGSAPKPTAAPKPSGPPEGDPKVFLTKVQDAGRGAQEREKEAKSGKDDRMVWALNRFERDRTYANYRSGPVDVVTKSIITRDAETAHTIFEEEAKLNEKFPEAKDKVSGLFEFNMKGDEDVGDEAKGASACVVNNCGDKENELHRRMVFRVGPYVGVLYTFGLDDPEGNTQAYSRRIAAIAVKKMRDAL